jgi:tRNA G18 (ribose-2'-O)-methylase SpoU
MLNWEHTDKAEDVVKDYKKKGFKVIALEQSPRSVDYKKVVLRETKKMQSAKALVILGNEVEGVSKELLKLSDVIAEIPMKGKKESLNVSVATGIFLYRLFDQ